MKMEISSISLLQIQKASRNRSFVRDRKSSAGHSVRPSVRLSAMPRQAMPRDETSIREEKTTEVDRFETRICFFKPLSPFCSFLFPAQRNKLFQTSSKCSVTTEQRLLTESCSRWLLLRPLASQCITCVYLRYISKRSSYTKHKHRGTLFHLTSPSTSSQLWDANSFFVNRRTLLDEEPDEEVDRCQRRVSIFNLAAI